MVEVGRVFVCLVLGTVVYLSLDSKVAVVLTLSEVYLYGWKNRLEAPNIS